MFEPGHTAAEFAVRHMMVSWVRGAFKNVKGSIVFDPQNPATLSVDVVIKTKELWSGEKARDNHLKSKDFFHISKYPTIRFKGKTTQVIGENDFRVTGKLTIRGITKKATLDVRYLGQWNTPFWVKGKDKGPMVRAGFVATTTINRYDFGVKWNSPLEKGGLVAGKDVLITIDVEALKK